MGVAVAFAVIWGVCAGAVYGAVAFYMMMMIMLSVGWTTLTSVLLLGVTPACALFGGVPAAILFRRGKPPWQIVLAILGAALSLPLLFVLTLLSTERVH